MKYYDHGIHSNPDAVAWAKFFCETMAELKQPAPAEDIMHGWFANAMMAMHDHVTTKIGDLLRSPPESSLPRWNCICFHAPEDHTHLGCNIVGCNCEKPAPLYKAVSLTEPLP